MTESGGDSFISLLILGLIALARILFEKKIKKSKEKAPPKREIPRPPPQPIPLPPEPVQVVSTIESLEEKPEVKENPVEYTDITIHSKKRRKRSHIQGLVSRVGNKRNLILLSEILKRPGGLHASTQSPNKKTYP